MLLKRLSLSCTSGDVSQTRDDTLTCASVASSLSFAMKGSFSLWRVVAVVQVAPSAPQMFVQPTNLHTSGTLATVFRVTKKEFFLRGFDRVLFKAKTCLHKLEHGRHFLQMVAIQLRHARALESHVAWSPFFCGEDGLPIFSISPWL